MLMFCLSGMCIPAIAMASIGYVPEGNPAVSVTLLVIAVALNAGCYQSFLLSPMDLAPNFAATIVGIISTIASFIGIFAPIATGKIVTNHVSLTNITR